jgi:ceramide glucosyltransferase
MGADPNLSQNLETFFTMKYPKFELLFCIENKEDPAVEIAQQLINKYPKIDAKIFVGGSKVGVNPKINNMNPAYEDAKYDYFLISDSSNRTTEDTLEDMMLLMEDDVGLVHQLPFACDRVELAAASEQLLFSTGAWLYIIFLYLGKASVIGMSTLFRKEIIAHAGDLRAFGKFLCEDFYLAETVKKAGFKIKLCNQPVWQNSGSCSLKTFMERIVRWCQLIAYARPFYAIAPFFFL